MGASGLAPHGRAGSSRPNKSPHESRRLVLQIEYPLYLVPLEAGYVSVVEPAPGDKQTYYLAVFTDEQRAEHFMQACGIEGEPRPLHNAREFAWLVQSLHAPISNLAFDPSAESKSVEARWKVSAQEVLDNLTAIDYSPWNYPIFVIQQPGGFASIEGDTSDGQQMRALGLFTTKENAEQFLRDASAAGVVRQLDDMNQARDFLASVAADVTAVALNLTADEGQRSAKYCFSIRTVLDKYLVEHDGETE